MAITPPPPKIVPKSGDFGVVWSVFLEKFGVLESFWNVWSVFEEVWSWRKFWFKYVYNCPLLNLGIYSVLIT